jgi:hypothetical protein
MRKSACLVSAALLVPLFLSGGSVATASTEWEKIVQTTQLTVYIQTTTLTKNDREASVVTLLNYGLPDRAFNGKPYRSALSRTKYNCIKKRSRVLVLTYYVDKWAGGKEVYETDKPDAWRDIDYGSPNEVIFNLVCSRKPIPR